MQTKEYIKKWNKECKRVRIASNIEGFIHQPRKNPTPACRVVIMHKGKRYCSQPFYDFQQAIDHRDAILKQNQSDR